MARAGLIAAGVAACAIALAAGWFFFLRDTAEPVSVEEAVESFETETGGASGWAPFPQGVYVYATGGYEKTDALTGVTHHYPARSTITATAAECGLRLLWRVLEGRSTEWIFCVTDEGWELRSQDERHTFFGRTERTTYLCDDAPIRPKTAAEVSCSTDGSRERGAVQVVGLERVRVGRKVVTTQHVRRTSRFDGAIEGTARHDLWFDARSGLLVRIVMASRTTNDSPVGDVHYEERVTLRLTSLEPRR
jgi:hypothetical protein